MFDALLQSAIRNPQSTILGGFSPIDLFAAGIILAGISCQLLHRRMPPGLGTSLFVGATTVGAVTAAFHHRWPAADQMYWPAPAATYTLSRTTAVLCALWAFFAYLASCAERKGREAPIPNPQSPIRNPQSQLVASPSATFFAWSLVTAVAVVAVTAYVLIFATCSRLLNPDRFVETLPAGGLWNVILLLTATLSWAASASRRQQPTISLILTALLVWWTSLMIPSAVGTYQSTPAVLMPLQPVWWNWTFQMQFGLAAVLLIAAVLQEANYRMPRSRAWPDRLEDLRKPYSRWPAYTQTESVVAAAILLLGVFQIVRRGPPSWELAIANSAVSLVAGVACLFMTYRRWSANTAALGMALLTLAAVTLACALAPLLGSPPPAAAYAARLPVVYNAILFALAAMIALWSWLGRFWEQQLLNGVAWTTTGRMIPYTHRTAYLLTALGVLVAFHMALWPRLVSSIVEDDSPGRLVAGISAILFLALITARNARQTDSAATATLGAAFLIAALLFVFIRLPAPVLRGWITQHVAVVFSGLALPVLIAAEILQKTRWRCFSMPLWWMALLLLPVGALTKLLSSQRLPADWVRPVTFAILGTLYLFAGSREHRRAMLVLGAVLWLVALTTLYRFYSPT
jgi:hypothetical protein